MSIITRMFTKVIAFVRGLPLLYSIGGAVILVALGLLAAHFITRAPSATSAPATVSHVHLASVASLSSASGPLPVTGTVTSLSQASILAQTSGEIVSLSHALGDHVAAGAIIGQFENSAQRAAVLQAEGSYEAAQASLSKISGTTAQNSSITSAQAGSSAEDARAAAANALQSAYGALDDAVHAKADPMFSNPRGTSPQLAPFTIADSQLVLNIENERAQLETTLSTALSLSASNGADIDASIASMTAAAQTVHTFLNNLVQGVNEALPNQYVSAATIAADQAAAAAARTEVVAAISSLTSAKGAYDAAVSAASTAANSATGGSASDIASAQASVKSAQGALNAAQSSLEKTIIRSPISGTIVSLPVTQGDFVSAFSPVAQVSNPGALYIEVNVTSDDAKTLAVGNVATIDGSVPGVITFVAPALDPSTGKIEVKVGVTGSQGSLTDGETVSLSLNRATVAPVVANSTITIPIVAVKITPMGAAVFQVSASSTLTSTPIQLGAILGDRVVVPSGLSPTMQIVTDARGLSVGETVVVDTPTNSVNTPAATSTSS